MISFKIYDMEKLTLEYTLENKFRPIDCIKYFNPKWTNEHCNFYYGKKLVFLSQLKRLLNS